VITVLVLAENGEKAVIALLADRILLGLLAEVEVELDEGEQSDAPQSRRDTSLKNY